MKANSIIAVFLVVLPVLISCKPKVPSAYIQPDKMEDILYDYYIADGMAVNENEQSEDNAYNNFLYKLAVLKKYGVSSAEFDSSLVYYARHADRLHEIYENIDKRLSNAAVGLGASAGELHQLGNISETGDTTEVWTGERSCVLSSSVPLNVMSYSIKADTAFHKGDRLVLSLDTRFIYQEGMKDGVAMLALRLGNDSVVSRMIHMSSNSHYTLNVSDDRMNGIKEVYGFIFLSKNKDAAASTMKLMFVDNIRLVRVHRKSFTKEPTGNSSNAASEDTIRDNNIKPGRQKEEGGMLQPMRMRNDVMRKISK